MLVSGYIHIGCGYIYICLRNHVFVTIVVEIPFVVRLHECSSDFGHDRAEETLTIFILVKETSHNSFARVLE